MKINTGEKRMAEQSNSKLENLIETLKEPDKHIAYLGDGWKGEVLALCPIPVAKEPYEVCMNRW